MLQNAAKNIWVKGEGTVDHKTVTGWFKKFSYCKNLDHQQRPGSPKTVNFKNCSPSHRDKSSKEYSESIRQTWPLIVQYGLSPSWPTFDSS